MNLFRKLKKRPLQNNLDSDHYIWKLIISNNQKIIQNIDSQVLINFLDFETQHFSSKDHFDSNLKDDFEHYLKILSPFIQKENHSNLSIEEVNVIKLFFTIKIRQNLKLKILHSFKLLIFFIQILKRPNTTQK